MVLLFKPFSAELILAGKKTQTRRIWKKPRVIIGGIYKAKTNLFSREYFALIRVTGLRKEKLKDMSEDDAIAEGATSLTHFKEIWKDIYGTWNPEQEVWVVEFEVLRDCDETDET